MAERRPLVLIGSTPTELPEGDSLPKDLALLTESDIGATVCSYTDERLSDARTPTAHTHTSTNISDSTTAGRAILTAADAAAQRAALSVAQNAFDRICEIAGIQPTLYLDFAWQDFRHYSPATGLREKALSDIVTFTRTSSATYFDAKGVMQIVGSNVPRLDFDPVTGECEGLLIEESRTNLFLNSLLDGTNLSTQTVTVTAAAHTISFYGTGSITLSGAHSATITGTSDTTRTALTFTPTAGSLTCTVSGTVKWANCELGSFATSFIPTTTTAATRAADVAVIYGTAFSDFYRHGVGVVLVSAINPTGTNDVIRRLWSISDGSDSNRLTLNTATNKQIAAFSSSGLWNLGNVAYADNQLFHAAFAFTSGNNAIAVSGNNAQKNTLNIPTQTMQNMTIGTMNNGILQPCGHIARLSYWPVRLPNATLQQLTAE